MPGMNSQFAVFLPLGSCDLKTQGLMENSELSSINTICGDCMVRDGGKKKKKPRTVPAFTKLTI